MGLLLDAHYIENGAYPESLETIAVGLGGVLPLDPFTGEDYKYQPSENGFLLYSLGVDQEDNGGQPLSLEAIAARLGGFGWTPSSGFWGHHTAFRPSGDGLLSYAAGTDWENDEVSQTLVPEGDIVWQARAEW
jgi:hypothetical protein